MAHQQASHVPKFGNWDSDNIPYTAFFENARREKSIGSAVRVNPNDPEQNPEAFKSYIPSSPNIYSTSDSLLYSCNKSPNDPMRSGKSNHDLRKNNTSSRSKNSSESSRSDNSLTSIFKLKNRRDRSDRSRFPSEDFSSRSVSVPKFGEWDEKNPTSGEGFTVIFNKVKEEKQIAANKIPPVPIFHNNQNMNNYMKSPKKKPRSKKCCGLF